LTRGVSASKGAGLVAAAAVLVVSVPVASGAGSSDPRRGPEAHLELASSPSHYVPDELIVRFRAAATRVAARRAHARAGARVTMRFPAFRMQVVKLPRGLAVRDAVREYEDDPAVEFAEPNYLRYPTLTPTDPLFTDLWGLANTGQAHAVTDVNGDSTAIPRAGTADKDIDASEAWDVPTGTGTVVDAGTVVAVIDSGVDVTHPDLSGQLWTNPSDPANGFDDDGNGKIDDVNGWDFGNNDNGLLGTTSFPGYDHGTHVAGTIAAALDGATGVVGVCPGCKIMTLKVARDSDGAMPISAGIAALAYAKSMGVKIANLSVAGPMWSNAEREALRTSGLLAVIAAGNDSLDNDMALASDLDGNGSFDIFSPSYPASYTLGNILAVGASNHGDEHGYSTECHTTFGFSKPQCAFTNWGHDSVDLSAPGVDVTSAVPGGGWETWDGTSMAAPHVAGVAALVQAHNPAFTVAQVKNAVMRSVDKPTSLKTMYIAQSPGLTGARTKTGAFTRTSGRVNALTALTAATTNATPRTDGNVDGAKAMKAKALGAVAWPGDVNDVKKRKLYKGRTYRITLVVPRGKDYDLYVWKPGTKEIWQFGKLRRWSARAGAVDEVVKFKARATGVYYIQVSAWLFKSGSYTLKIARIS
jgi:subtilisin family serine protease